MKKDSERRLKTSDEDHELLKYSGENLLKDESVMRSYMSMVMDNALRSIEDTVHNMRQTNTYTANLLYELRRRLLSTINMIRWPPHSIRKNHYPVKINDDLLSELRGIDGEIMALIEQLYRKASSIAAASSMGDNIFSEDIVELERLINALKPLIKKRNELLGMIFHEENMRR